MHSITSLDSQRHYYDHLNYWRSVRRNSNLCIIPTIDDAREYLMLKARDASHNLKDRLLLRKHESYCLKYDWRPMKIYKGGACGLVSPAGEQLIPPVFRDAFNQFDSFDLNIRFIPVFNGEAWAIVSMEENPMLMTDFKYETIIPERWDMTLFFVQDSTTHKWGTLLKYRCHTNGDFSHNRLWGIYEIVPCIADEIYEDQLMTECAPTLFFVVRVGKKIGILTPFGVSKIEYDNYVANSENMTFRMIRNDSNRTNNVDYWCPAAMEMHDRFTK